MKDLHTENYKTLLKEIEDTKNGKILPGHKLEKFVLLKMLILCKTTYGFHAIFNKILQN